MALTYGTLLCAVHVHAETCVWCRVGLMLITGLHAMQPAHGPKLKKQGLSKFLFGGCAPPLKFVRGRQPPAPVLQLALLTRTIIFLKEEDHFRLHRIIQGFKYLRHHLGFKYSS